MKEISLKEVRAMIKHFKAHECPRLGQRKEILMKFAEEHGLLKHHHEARELAAKSHEAKKAEEAKPPAVVKDKKAEEPIKGRKEMSGAEMAQYDLAKQRRDKKALEHFHKAFPGLLESKKAEAPPMSPKDKNAARLKEVQKIRKEKGVSLKEAWALVKKGEPVQEKKEEKIKYVEPNWFKSVNDPEYFKIMTSKERRDSYNYIFGMGEEKFSSKMLPHLKNGYIAWCKRYNKQCLLTKN